MSAVSCVAYPFLYLYAQADHVLKMRSLELQEKTTLRKTIEQLEEENQHLKKELVHLRATTVYADSIQELRAFKERYHFDHGIIAQILRTTLTDYEQTLIVNAGSRHGVTKDMVVLMHNCLAGKVVEVYPWYAKVRLITDAQCKVSAVCSSTGATGIHHGGNKAFTTLEHVSHLDTVKEGDLILSTGKGMIFPQGFALGTVTESSINGLVHTITVQPLFSLKTLSYCLLISKEACESH